MTRVSLVFLAVLFNTVSIFAQQIRVPKVDTIPGKGAIVPFKVKLPPLPLPRKDTSTRGAAANNLLTFPFVVHSLETNWGFGGIAARFFKAGKRNDSAIRTSDINFLGLYTLRQQLVLVLNSTVYFPKEDRIARFQASYSYFPSDFWGLGDHSSYLAEEGYSQKQIFIDPQFLQRIHDNFYLGVNYQFQHTSPVSYTPGGLFDTEKITGRSGGNTSGIGPILSWDTRNNAFSPDHGFFAELQYAWFSGFLGSDFDFRVFSADIRKFIYLSPKTVLALQGLSGLTFGNTPFRYLEELGGADMMRGYYGGRFTDKCLQAYQAEYRRFLFWRIGVVAFAAIGEVAPAPGQFQLNGFHYSYGAGGRFALSKAEKLNLRVDYGIAKHSNAFTVQLREAF